MSRLASLVISWVGRGAARRFDAAARDPVSTQRALLLRILTRNRDTEYGREFGFRSIRSFEDYRSGVPVVDYEQIRDRVVRVTHGEPNILTAEEPVMFARTSGTTGDAKFIPVTPTCRSRQQGDSIRAWIHHAMEDHPALFSGKAVSLVSPAVEGTTPCGKPYGSTSGHIYRHMPAIIRSTYAIPYPVFEIEDYETKYYVLLRLSLAERVTFLSTANPSSVMKLCELADQYADRLLKDIHDGTIDPGLGLSRNLRRSLERRLRPDRERAHGLTQARERRGGRLLPVDYWPDLQLIGCWKGGTVGAYLERFPQWFDPEGDREVPVRDWGYLSSEARGSVPLSDVGHAGVLTVAANVFEFAPIVDVDEKPEAPNEWRFLGISDLRIGEEYYIFLTTTGGLYRYDINDVVQVVDFHFRTPMVVFRRKGRGMTNITGEKVSVNQVIEAFQRAGRERDLSIAHFKAEADPTKSRYVFKIETPRPLAPNDRVLLLRTLDHQLQILNLEYAAKRASLRLNDPVLHVMRPGWYDRSKRRLAAEGKRLWQAKTVVLSTRGPSEDEDLEAVVLFGEAP